MHQEVPHEMGVLVKSIKDEGSRWLVDVDIIVNRASQKPIVIGRQATTIKYVRKCAERELSDIFGVKVMLELWVRVEPDWMSNKRLLAEMGYLGELV
jgi:GTP-binding protein Era